jgi:alpha-mannosidase
MYFEYHRGVMTSQANHKKNMRDSEEQMLNAEKWASLAWLDGRAYPASELTEDWKKVLFNQFHDLAAGSGIGIIYKDAQKDYDYVRLSTNEISSGSLSEIAHRIDTHLGSNNWIPVVLWNPLGWERTGDVTVKVQEPNPKSAPAGQVKAFLWSYGEDKTRFPFAQLLDWDASTGVATVKISGVQVPALGYRVIYVIPGSYGTANPAEPPSSSAISVANTRIRLSVDKSTGCITSITDLKSNFDWLATGKCGNQLQFFKDKPKDYDAWNIDPGTLDVSPALIDRADSVELLPGNPGAPIPQIRIVSHWQSSKFVQTISLEPNSDLVDIDNDIDWHESHIFLKAAFPLAASGPFATYEIPYGTIDRPTTRNNSWEKAQFEVTGLRWADLGDGKHGLAILNQDKYGYDAAGNVLRLSLLRSPKWPDPEADMGRHHFHYALYPHAGTWKDANTVRHGYEYNYPLQAVVTTAHAGALPARHSFAAVNADDVVLTALKKAEDANGLIFRVYEWAGKGSDVEIHVPPGATSAVITNMQETPEGAPLQVTGDVVKAPIHPYEILTLRVDYPTGGPRQ